MLNVRRARLLVLLFTVVGFIRQTQTRLVQEERVFFSGPSVVAGIPGEQRGTRTDSGEVTARWEGLELRIGAISFSAGPGRPSSIFSTSMKSRAHQYGTLAASFAIFSTSSRTLSALSRGCQAAILGRPAGFRVGSQPLTS